MTLEAQRIAIAEAEGFKRIGMCGDGRLQGDLPPCRGWVEIPDYLNDLNQMHEMEKLIIQAGGTHTAYISELQRLTQHEDNPAFSHIWHATAAQKAEAFMKACGLWKE